MKLAITGGTGFVGARLLGAATSNGHQVRALTRRATASRPGVEWVAGALDQPAALQALVEGSDAVIHVAGVINGRTAADFDACNVAGTEALLEAAHAVEDLAQHERGPGFGQLESARH